MYPQYLPHYNHNFLQDNRWLKKTYTHHVFFYFPNSVAQQDIKTIARRQEQAYKKIIRFLGVREAKKRITYYLYPNKKTKSKLMGDDWYAQSIYNEFRIHVLYTKKIKPIGEHEDTHLLSLPWGLAVGFFQEGLAEYLSGHAWDGQAHTKHVKTGYRKKIYTSLNVFFDHKFWVKTSDNHAIFFYSLSGAFVQFLITKFGKEKFKRIYKGLQRNASQQKNADLFTKIYNTSIKESEFEFRKWLEKKESSISSTATKTLNLV